MEYKKGYIVKSLSGHDKDFFYIIIEEKENFVTVADGRLKPLDKPKKKNKKHVQLIESDVTGVGQKISDGKVQNADIVYALRTYKESTKCQSQT